MVRDRYSSLKSKCLWNVSLNKIAFLPGIESRALFHGSGSRIFMAPAPRLPRTKSYYELCQFTYMCIYKLLLIHKGCLELNS